MNAIHSKSVQGYPLPVIYCEGGDTMKVFGMLESHPSVESYKVIDGNCGTMTKGDLEYLYNGYLKPAGKLVEKLYE